MLRRHRVRTSILSALSVGVLACGGDSRANPFEPGDGSATSGPGTASASETEGAISTTGMTGASGASAADETGGDDDPGNDDDAPPCIDNDGDGYGENCPAGPDCDDTNPHVWTEEACASCMDADGDGYWVGCDTYDSSKLGPDCDDNNPYVWTEAGCANCRDADGDGYWVGCDHYDENQPGPDCDDDNPLVGPDDSVEVCDGQAQNCAGEIDAGSPNSLCPTPGVSAPNVTSWLCQPPEPGVDGCVIAMCEDQFFDVDGLVEGGCECAGTSRQQSLASCGNAAEGLLGSVAEGGQLQNLPIGTIPYVDNGMGGGREDWYRVQFPLAAANGPRPFAGSIRVDFAVNTDNAYRFQVFRSCNAVPFNAGLATQFGVGAPPAREWWFFDSHATSQQNNIAWPEEVYVRVIRISHDATCSPYQLRILRVPT